MGAGGRGFKSRLPDWVFRLTLTAGCIFGCIGAPQDTGCLLMSITIRSNLVDYDSLAGFDVQDQLRETARRRPSCRLPKGAEGQRHVRMGIVDVDKAATLRLDHQSRPGHRLVQPGSEGRCLAVATGVGKTRLQAATPRSVLTPRAGGR